MKVKEILKILKKVNQDLPIYISIIGASSISIEDIDTKFINAVLIKPGTKLDIVREINEH